MIMAKNEDGTYSQVGFVKDNAGIDTEYIYDKDGDIVFEKGFTRETSGTVPLTINGIGKDLKAWSIVGNTVQNGTPTPENPVEVQAVGDRTANLFYKIMSRTNIDSAGRIITNVDFDMVVAKVAEGETYSVSGVSSVMGFFVNEPEVGSQSYNKIRESIVSPVTIPQGVNYAVYRVTARPNVAMLNEGSTALPYEPYGYKILISSANTTTPVYLGEVESTRRIKKLVLDSTENWKEGTSNYYIFINVSGKGNSIPNSTALSTHTESGVVVNNNGTALFFKKSVFVHSSLADFKTYLAQQYAAGTPVTVWYILAEPATGIVNEPLMKIGTYTDTVSKEQAGVEIPTNNGTTVIDVDTAVKPTEMYIKYKSNK